MVDGSARKDRPGSSRNTRHTYGDLTGFLLIRTDPPTDPLPFVNGKKNVTKRVGRVWFYSDAREQKNSRACFPTRLVCPS
jgi:hypothetical protein